MKCPKCGYISFDFNLVCPKCTKDISAERQKLNLPEFRPHPPSLLGALTGEANESNVGIRISPSAGEDLAEEVAFGLDDSGAIAVEDLALEDSQEIELGLGPEGMEEPAFAPDDSLSDFELEGGGEEGISLDTGEISLEESEASPALPEEEEGISFDLDDFSTGESEIEGVAEEAGEEPELGLDLDSIALEEPEAGAAGPAEEGGISLDDISLEEPSLDLDAEQAAEGPEEPTLNLDDFALDESGEVEAPEEPGISLDDISLEEPSLDLDAGQAAEGPEETTISLDDFA
ncbi:MAG: hypothetical protein JW821_18725, partial [Deltaproteobacteria bacterium]|nr:hypothetical protein [Deltaproteobacteria bacterium]